MQTEPKYNRGDFVKHKKYKTILQIWKIMQDGDNITYEAGIPDTMFTTYSYVIAKESDLAHAYN